LDWPEAGGFDGSGFLTANPAAGGNFCLALPSAGALAAAVLVAGGLSAGGLPSGARPSGGLVADGLAVGGLAVGGLAVGGLAAGGLPVDGLPAAGLLAGGLVVCVAGRAGGFATGFAVRSEANSSSFKTRSNPFP
jgi:hypothetical protein